MSRRAGDRIVVGGKAVRRSEVMSRDAAIARYSDDLTAKPDDLFLLYCRPLAVMGKARWDAPDRTQISRDLNKANRLGPQTVAVHSALGEYYRVAKDCDQALRHFSIAISLDPANSLSYSNRGEGYWDLGDFTKADADIDKALSLDPDCAYANYDKAVSLRRTNDPLHENYDPEIDQAVVKHLEAAIKNAHGYSYGSFRGPEQIRGRMSAGPWDEFRRERLLVLSADALAWVLSTRHPHQWDDGCRAIIYAWAVRKVSATREYSQAYDHTLEKAFQRNRSIWAADRPSL